MNSFRKWFFGARTIFRLRGHAGCLLIFIAAAELHSLTFEFIERDFELAESEFGRLDFEFAEDELQI